MTTRTPVKYMPKPFHPFFQSATKAYETGELVCQNNWKYLTGLLLPMKKYFNEKCITQQEQRVRSLLNQRACIFLLLICLIFVPLIMYGLSENKNKDIANLNYFGTKTFAMF